MDDLYEKLNDSTKKHSFRYALARELIIAKAKNRAARRQLLLMVGNALGGKLDDSVNNGKRFWVFPDNTKAESKL